MNIRFVFAAVAFCCAGALSHGQADCPVILAPVATGTPENTSLDEISGILASRSQPGLIWAVNDSGAPALYALAEDGRHLGRFLLSGATLTDWEDISFGPGPSPGTDYLYVADTGNNNATRTSVRVYRLAEPTVTWEGPPADETVAAVETFTLTYPDAPFDCEAFAVDPHTGVFYLFKKDGQQLDGGYCRVYRTEGAPTPGSSVSLAHALDIWLGQGLDNFVTAADIAPDASGILLRTYGYAYFWPWLSSSALETALGGQACLLPAASEVQGESIAFASDWQGFYTTSEWYRGQPQPVYFHARVPEEAEGDPDCGNARGGFYEVGDRLCLRIPDRLAPQAPYRWYRNGEAMESGGRVAGAASRSLVVMPLETGDTGYYACTYGGTEKAPETFGPVYVSVGQQVPLAGGAALLSLAGALAALGATVARRRGK